MRLPPTTTPPQSLPESSDSTEPRSRGRRTVTLPSCSRCCRLPNLRDCRCRINNHGRKVHAQIDPNEMRAILLALQTGSNHDELAEHIQLKSYFLERGTKLEKVNGRDGDVHALLMECIINESSHATVVFKTAPAAFLAELCFKCPCLILIAAFLVIGGIIGAGFRVPTITTELDGASSDADLASKVAGDVRKAIIRGILPRRLQEPTHIFAQKNLAFIYKSKKEESLQLSLDVLKYLHKFEQKLREQSSYINLCKITLKDDTEDCYGTSFLNDVFPSESTVGQNSLFKADGKGSRSVPLAFACRSLGPKGADVVFPHEGDKDCENRFEHATTSRSFGICQDRDPMCSTWSRAGGCLTDSTKEVFMRDFCPVTCGLCAAPNVASVAALRSVFTFKIVLSAGDDGAGVDKVWDDFINGVIDFTNDFVERSEDSLPTILITGTTVEDTLLNRALNRDFFLGIGTILFTFFYVSLHTKSILFSCVGLILSLLSVPTTLSIYFLITGQEQVTILVGLAFFIIVGVASDMLFIWSDLWRISALSFQTRSERMKFLYGHASASTWSTTLTTAVSLYSNMTSILTTLREVGFILGSAIIVAWLISVVTFPPLLIINDKIHCCGSRSAGTNTIASATAEAEKELAGRANHVAKKRGVFSRCRAALPGTIQKLRVYIVVFFWISIITCSLVFAFNFSTDTESPLLLPDSHNNVVVGEAEKLFASLSGGLTSKDPVHLQLGCTDLRGNRMDCNFYRCHAVNPRLGSATHCSCSMTSASTASREEASLVRVEPTVIGSEDNINDFQTLHILPLLEETFKGSAPIRIQHESNPTRDLLSTYWETGEASLNKFKMPQPILIPQCRTSFEDLIGTTLKVIEVTESLEQNQNSECCKKCQADPNCTFWVKKGSNGKLICELKNKPERHESSPDVVGGWSALGSVAKFKDDLEGKTIDKIERYAADDTSEEANLWCWRKCCDNDRCVFWVLTFEDATATCHLRENPGNHRAGSQFTRGGWGCSAGPTRSEKWSCNCGVRGCHSESGGSEQGSFEITRQIARRQASGPEQGFLVPVNARQSVLIVFGTIPLVKHRLLGSHQGATFKYSEQFKLSSPWSQRAALRACTIFPAHLKVVDTSCWLHDFKESLWEFPVREPERFIELAKEWVSTSSVGLYGASRFVLFDGDSIRAFYSKAFLDVASNHPTSEVMDLMKSWDLHWDEFNMHAEESIRGVFHASSFWARASLESTTAMSLIISMTISLGCVWIGSTVFSRSIRVGVMVLAMACAIIVFLLFFITVVLGWALGGLEVLAMVLFVGLSVDYLLHVVHAYNRCHISAEENVKGDEDDVWLEFGLRGAPFYSQKSQKSQKTNLDRGAPFYSQKSFVIRASENTQKAYEQHGNAERFVRTSFALETIGKAIAGSAMTAIGCAFFFVFAVIRPFFKIGVLVIFVVAISIGIAIIVLPAHMMMCGPVRNGVRRRFKHRFRKAQKWYQDHAGPSLEPPARGTHRLLSIPPHGVTNVVQSKSPLKICINIKG